MKKFVLILFALCIALSLAACKTEDGGESKAPSENSSVSDSAASAEKSDGVSNDIVNGSIDSGDYDGFVSGETDVTSSAPPTSYEEISTDSVEVYADNTYSIYLKKNSDTEYTLTALVPEGIESGKLVISYSDKLSLVEGSVATKLSGAYTNEKYSRNGVEGICVAFASTEAYQKGLVAISASFTVGEGVTISAEDIGVPEWNLVSGGKYLSTHRDTSASVKYISK